MATHEEVQIEELFRQLDGKVAKIKAEVYRMKKERDEARGVK
jgi:hypothetical protein